MKSNDNAEPKVTRAKKRHQARTDRLKRERDFVSDWLDSLLKSHIKDMDKLSPLDKHLLLMEENALQQLVTSLNARVRFAEVKSRDMNGEVIHDTPVLEMAFVRGPRYFSKRKPATNKFRS